MGCLTCAKVAEMPTKKVAMAHKTAPSAITWALLWLTAAYAANGAQSACIRERTRVSDPNFAGEACNSKPISLYTPGSNASSALSIIAARLTITSVRSASSLHHLKPHILVFWVFQWFRFPRHYESGPLLTLGGFAQKWLWFGALLKVAIPVPLDWSLQSIRCRFCEGHHILQICWSPADGKYMITKWKQLNRGKEFKGRCPSQMDRYEPRSATQGSQPEVRLHVRKPQTPL